MSVAACVIPAVCVSPAACVTGGVCRQRCVLAACVLLVVCVLCVCCMYIVSVVVVGPDLQSYDFFLFINETNHIDHLFYFIDEFGHSLRVLVALSETLSLFHLVVNWKTIVE
jgi:hypothetical protein